MRLLTTAVLTAGVTFGFAGPALAKPDIPVTVTGEPNGGICVTISEQVPQCVDLGQP
jgi:hypothetical protein